VQALVGQRGRDVLLVAGRVPGHEFTRTVPDQVQDLAGLEPGGTAGGDPGGDPALEARDAHHEELVQIAGEDRQKIGPF
jgi:hypothetical protein